MIVYSFDSVTLQNQMLENLFVSEIKLKEWMRCKGFMGRWVSSSIIVDYIV